MRAHIYCQLRVHDASWVGRHQPQVGICVPQKSEDAKTPGFPLTPRGLLKPLSAYSCNVSRYIKADFISLRVCKHLRGQGNCPFFIFIFLSII